MTVRWTTAFLDFPAATFGSGCSFWQGVTGYGLSPPRGVHGEFATLEPPQGDAYLRVQRVESDRAGCHIDLHVDDVEGTAGRAATLGALTKEARPSFCVMASPAGLPFCLVAAPTDEWFERPPPTGWPGGHQSLVDQVCIDIAPGSFSDEATFWAALTGWERRPGSRPEFEYLVRPRENPTSVPVATSRRRPSSAAPAVPTSTSPATTWRPSASVMWRWARPSWLSRPGPPCVTPPA